MRIAVDAMGGDFAPGVVVEGAVEALKEYNLQIVLVGKEKLIKDQLKRFRVSSSRLQIHSAEEVIGMHEPATVSIRKKRNSSISVAIELLKEGKVQGVVSAGNTGAVVCAATFNLGLLSGIERAGIGILIPTLKGASLVIDVGANIDAKPLHLFQYAIMASAYVKEVLDIDNPSVGILNIAEEESKGPEFIRETHNLLERSNLNFIGNIEAKDIFSGKSDIIVTDGFVGNVALKVSESFAEAIKKFLFQQLTKHFLGKWALFLIKRSLSQFSKGIDYVEYGGAPLLGVNGVVIISHGRSPSKAIKNAIRVAKEEIERSINTKIVEEINQNRIL